MTERTPKRLNAVGKPLSPLFDPHYRVLTPLTSIDRLRAYVNRRRPRQHDMSAQLTLFDGISPSPTRAP
jgi:hypothetical protein